MIARLKTAWKRHPILTSGFLLALGLTVFFSFRSVAFFIYWSDPARHEQPIAAWMTPRYVAHSWKVPPQVIMQVIGQDAMPKKRSSLQEIAEQQGRDLQSLIGELTEAVETFEPAPR